MKNLKHGALAKKATPLQKKAYAAWLNIKHRAFRDGQHVEEDWADDFTKFLTEVGLPPAMRYKLRKKKRVLGYVRGNMYWDDPISAKRANKPAPGAELSPYKRTKLTEMLQRHADELTRLDTKHRRELKNLLGADYANTFDRPLPMPAEDNPKLGYYGADIRGNPNRASNVMTARKANTQLRKLQYDPNQPIMLRWPNKELYAAFDDAKGTAFRELIKRNEDMPTGRRRKDALPEETLPWFIPLSEYELPSPNALRAMAVNDTAGIRKLHDDIMGVAEKLHQFFGDIGRDHDGAWFDKDNTDASMFDRPLGKTYVRLLQRYEEMKDKRASIERRMRECGDDDNARDALREAELNPCIEGLGKLRNVVSTLRDQVYHVRRQHWELANYLRSQASVLDNLLATRIVPVSVPDAVPASAAAKPKLTVVSNDANSDDW